MLKHVDLTGSLWEEMKRRKASHMLKRLSPALLVLIGGSIIVLTAGSFLSRTITPLLRQSIAPANTPPALAYSILSIQAHQPAAPIVSIPPPFLTYVTPTPGGPSSPTPTMTQGTPTSPSVGNPGATLPPGSALPSESACAASITTSSFEPRPDNYAANHRVPTAAQIANLQPGIDVNIVRAEAVQESNWHQSQLGDYTTNQSLCPPGTWNGSSCYQSYGILQIKYTYFKTEWPMSQQDTAFSAEFVYGWLRNCYEGWADYLYQLTPSPGYAPYHAGDIWGCLGFWFSGAWYTSGAINYINIIKQDYQQKPWLQPGF